MFDISNAFAAKEVGALVPPRPTQMMDRRPNRPQVIQSADVFATDYNAGLYVLEFGG